MKKQTAELVAWAKKHGCIYIGVTKAGHVRIELPDGAIYTTAASPSDRNSWRQAQRDIARRLGIPIPAVPSGHYRRGTGRRGFSMRAAVAGRRPGLSGVFTVGDTSEPAGLTNLLTEEARLAAEYAASPSNMLRVRLIDIRARIRNRIY